MLNNISLSSPLADLEDVGPSWGHPAEAPFYNPKPKFPLQSPPAGADSISVPPESAEMQAQNSMHGPPEFGAFDAAASGMPVPFPDSPDDGSIDFTPFFAENMYPLSMPAVHPTAMPAHPGIMSPSPFTMHPVAYVCISRAVQPYRCLLT